MIKLGLTGGIATGKTTVAEIMREQGAVLIDADIIAHDLLNPGTLVWEEIVKTFGNEVLLPDNQIDRKKLGAIVFYDKKKLEFLNSIVHPYAIAETKNSIKYWMEKETSDNKSYLIVLVVPLLFETGTNALADYTIVVKCDKNVEIKRLMERNKLSEEDALKRISSQMDIDQKASMADYVIDNSRDLSFLKNEVDKILQNWKWDMVKLY